MTEKEKLWTSWFSSKLLPSCQSVRGTHDVEYKRFKADHINNQVQPRPERSGITLLQPLKFKKDQPENRESLKRNAQRLTINKIKEQIQRNDQMAHRTQNQALNKQISFKKLNIPQFNRIENVNSINRQQPQFQYRNQQLDKFKFIKTQRIVVTEKNHLNETKLSTTGRLSSTVSKNLPNQQTEVFQVETPSIQKFNTRTQVSKTYTSQNIFNEGLQKSQQSRLKQLNRIGIHHIHNLVQSRFSECTSQIIEDKIRLDQSVVEWTYQTGFKSGSSQASLKN